MPNQWWALQVLCQYCNIVDLRIPIHFNHNELALSCVRRRSKDILISPMEKKINCIICIQLCVIVVLGAGATMLLVGKSLVVYRIYIYSFNIVSQDDYRFSVMLCYACWPQEEEAENHAFASLRKFRERKKKNNNATPRNKLYIYICA